MYTRDQLSKFINDPEWVIIEDILKSFINPLVEIKNIDLGQDPATVKAQIIVRQELHKNITNFLEEIGLLKQIVGKNTTSYQ